MGVQKLCPWIMPRASTLFWCLRPMYWILLTKHRMPCWIHGWIWPLNPEPHRRYPCASCITLTSLLRAFSSPLKRGWESNSLLRQNRSNAEQRWALEAEHCLEGMGACLSYTLLLFSFLLHKDCSCWEGSAQRSEGSSGCFIPASQSSTQPLPILCL